jgi:hypothetical protein
MNREHKVILFLKEKNFVLIESPEKELYISISYQNIKYTVVQNDKVEVLQDYYYYKPIEKEKESEYLKELAQEDEILREKNWKSVLILSFPTPFTLIPKELFEANEIKKYLSFVDNSLKNDFVTYQEQTILEAFNVFSIKQNFRNECLEIYPQAQFTHITKAFIDLLLKNITFDNKDLNTHIFVAEDYLLLVIIEEGNLIFSNVFFHKTAQDFLYYVLFVLDDLRIDRQLTTIKLYGQINQVAEIYRLLSLYVNKLMLADKITTVELQEPFNNIPILRYIDLWAMM